MAIIGVASRVQAIGKLQIKMMYFEKLFIWLELFIKKPYEPFSDTNIIFSR